MRAALCIDLFRFHRRGSSHHAPALGLTTLLVFTLPLLDHALWLVHVTDENLDPRAAEVTRAVDHDGLVKWVVLRRAILPFIVVSKFGLGRGDAKLIHLCVMRDTHKLLDLHKNTELQRSLPQIECKSPYLHVLEEQDINLVAR